jgi:hypothetical protein
LCRTRAQARHPAAAAGRGRRERASPRAHVLRSWPPRTVSAAARTTTAGLAGCARAVPDMRSGEERKGRKESVSVRTVVAYDFALTAPQASQQRGTATSPRRSRLSRRKKRR